MTSTTEVPGQPCPVCADKGWTYQVHANWEGWHFCPACNFTGDRCEEAAQRAERRDAERRDAERRDAVACG